MHWFLILWVSVGGFTDIDPGFTMQRSVSPTVQQIIRLAMPSLEMCNAIRELNKSEHTECWALADDKAGSR